MQKLDSSTLIDLGQFSGLTDLIVYMSMNHTIPILYQAHTCKTLGVVTKLKSIASTHALMYPRNIIHACARGCNFILATTPSACTRPAPVQALGVVASMKVACISREAPRFLTLASKFFDNSSLLVRFRCLGVRSNLPLYMKTICWCPLPPQRWPRIAVKGIYRHNFRPVHF